ncbi:MAG TPA: hypothetical protein VGM87_25370 [Roseomonas sp.]|jgi:hypothetical protein
MSRSFIIAVVALALLSGCNRGTKTELDGGQASEPQIAAGDGPPLVTPQIGQLQVTALGHALFVDVCVRNLGHAEPLLRRAGERNLQLIREDVGRQGSATGPIRLYGIRAPSGAILIGLLINQQADGCAVVLGRPDTNLAMALLSGMALTWTRDGSRVLPVAMASPPGTTSQVYYRVQSTGNAARMPAPDWTFGLSVGADGTGMFLATLPRRARPNAPTLPGAPDQPGPPPAQPFVPHGILRNAVLEGRPSPLFPVILRGIATL